MPVTKKLKSMSTIKDDLKVLEYNPEDIFEKMTEEEKKLLLADCNLVFTKPSFKKVLDELSTFHVLKAVEEAETLDDHAFYRGIIHGVRLVYSVFEAHNQEYLANIKQPDPYDRNEII